MTRFGTGTLKKPIDRQEAIRGVVEIVEGMKKRTGIPYGMICKMLQLPLGSFNRWRCRIREDIVLIKRPGPKKVDPFDPSVLDTEIRLLDHGVKRSAGTTGLYQQYRFSVSRRKPGRMVEQVRQDLVSDRRTHLCRIEWLTPGVVWAVDFTEYDLGMAGKLYLKRGGSSHRPKKEVEGKKWKKLSSLVV
jgi:hypothetical protein